MKLERLSEQKDPARVLYYGDIGTGKTTDLAFMAMLGDVLFINKESGLKVTPLKRMGVPVEQILTVNPASHDEMEALFFTLKGTKKKFAGVAWDSLTDTQQAIMQEITETKAEKKGSDPTHATQDDWQKGNERMRRIVRRFRDLPLHIAFAALERRDVDVLDDDERVKYGPALTPGVQSDVGGYMDIVIRTRVVEVAGEIEYQGLTRPTVQWVAKDRFGVLPPILINPTMDRVIAYVEGRLVQDKDELQIAARDRRREATQPAKAKQEKKPAKKAARSRMRRVK